MVEVSVFVVGLGGARMVEVFWLLLHTIDGLCAGLLSLCVNCVAVALLAACSRRQVFIFWRVCAFARRSASRSR